MSESAVIGLAATIILGLVGVVYTSLRARILGLEEGLAAALKDIASLNAFEARFNATEAGWNLWRESFITETVGRRADTAKRLDSHSDDLKAHASRITKLERNGH